MEGHKSYQDNIYGNFSYPTAFKEIIKSSPVLRLYRIKQLGFLEYVYPGGDGHRFSHSLGVMFLMGKFIEILTTEEQKQNQNGYNFWKEVGMLCGLFHDLGHGPFSHSFESISELSHEVWTYKIINHYYSNFESKTDKKIKEKIHWVKLIFIKTYPKISEKLANNYENEPEDEIGKYCYYLIINLLSGPFDLDKLDYLLRDNESLGFGYNGVDFGWLMQNIGYEYDPNKRENSFVYFKEDACTALDQFIFQRICYYWKCIFHRKVRLLEILNKFLFQFLSEEDRYTNLPDNLKRIFRFIKFANTKEEIEGMDKAEVLEDYISYDDSYMWEFIKFVNGKVEHKSYKEFLDKLDDDEKRLLKNLTNPFLCNNSDFHCLYEAYSVDAISTDNDIKIRNELKEKSGKEKYLKYYYFWDIPHLGSHIKKEDIDIKVKRRQKGLKENKFFNLLERSQIKHLFIEGTLLRRYYACCDKGKSKDIQKNILGFEIEDDKEDNGAALET